MKCFLPNEAIHEFVHLGKSAYWRSIVLVNTKPTKSSFVMLFFPLAYKPLRLLAQCPLFGHLYVDSARPDLGIRQTRPWENSSTMHNVHGKLVQLQTIKANRFCWFVTWVTTGNTEGPKRLNKVLHPTRWKKLVHKIILQEFFAKHCSAQIFRSRYR